MVEVAAYVIVHLVCTCSLSSSCPIWAFLLIDFVYLCRISAFANQSLVFNKSSDESLYKFEENAEMLNLTFSLIIPDLIPSTFFETTCLVLWSPSNHTSKTEQPEDTICFRQKVREWEAKPDRIEPVNHRTKTFSGSKTLTTNQSRIALGLAEQPYAKQTVDRQVRTY